LKPTRRPFDIAQGKPFDTTRRHEAVLEGEKAALDAPPKVEEIVSRLREHGRIS
jgi:hypothetical protein